MALGGDCVGERGGGGCRVEAKGGGTMLGRDEGGDDEFAIFTQPPLGLKAQIFKSLNPKRSVGNCTRPVTFSNRKNTITKLSLI